MTSPPPPLPASSSSPPAAELTSRLLTRKLTADEIATRFRLVYEGVLRQSPRVTTPNFTEAARSDLALLFDLYDAQFFGGDLRQLLAGSGAPLVFDWSSRLTRSAGVTKRFAPRARRGEPPPPPARFEILLSSTLLAQTFREGDAHQRTVRVNGLICGDRLEAALRVFEHELLHLLEMLVWVKSSCSAERFKSLAWNYFGHTATRHDLVTVQEVARRQMDLHVGDRVSFELDGKRREGVINRITQRATVLVEDARGTRYSDGKRYAKFYVPVAMLQKVPEGDR